MLATTKQEARVIEAPYEGYTVTTRNYMGTVAQIGDGGPQAFMANLPPGKVIHSHFHPVDQFQVFFGTEGSFFGRNAMTPLYVQYADAYTPYGPFGAGSTDLNFFTLRAKATSEHFVMPESRSKMIRKAGRLLQSSVVLGGACGKPTCSTAFIEPQSDGLAAYLVSVGPDERIGAPFLENAGGQYCIVVSGEMGCDAGQFPFQSCLFVGPNEGPLEMRAKGPDGFEVLVLQYPRALQ